MTSNSSPLTQHSVLSTQNLELSPQHSALSTQSSTAPNGEQFSLPTQKDL